MSFHEMALLQTEFQLDEIKDEIQILYKNKAMTDAELNNKVKLENELNAKIMRYKKFWKPNLRQEVTHLPNMVLSQQLQLNIILSLELPLINILDAKQLQLLKVAKQTQHGQPIILIHLRKRMKSRN